MPILNCTVSNCYYNKEKLCCLDSINVEGNTAEVSDGTACGSFREKVDGNFTSSCKCEGSPEKKASIDCQAEKCTYNDSCKCTAGSIEIKGNDAASCMDTKCASFCK